MFPTTDHLLPHALALHELGACVVPMVYRSRVGRTAWTKYQHVRPLPDQLRLWFQDVDASQRGIAVVLGEVSRGLLCRDFDEMAAYNAWKGTQPALAKSLPTVKTTRGMHVYARCEGYREHPASGFVHKFKPDCRYGLQHGRGELRGDRHISVLPPTIHEKSGEPYSWLIKPRGSFPVISIQELGFIPNPASVTKDVYGLHLDGLPESVANAIRLSLPRQKNTRNALIFDFARRLHGLPECRGREPHELHKFVEVWHQLALPYIGTKPLAKTIADFDRGFPLVKHSLGEGGLALAIENARTKSLPELPFKARDTDMYLLAAVCRELQIQRGTLPFYLSTRNVAQLLGFTGTQPQVRAHRWLLKLVHTKVLKVEQAGDPFIGGAANQYRYLLPLD